MRPSVLTLAESDYAASDFLAASCRDAIVSRTMHAPALEHRCKCATGIVFDVWAYGCLTPWQPILGAKSTRLA